MVQAPPFSVSGPSELALLQLPRPPSPSLKFASLSPSHLPLPVAASPPHASEDDDCSLLEEEDEDLASEVLLHVAYEVVSQLDMAEDFRSLSLEEQSLCGFLVEQIHSL
jgi:hypothetical protein